MTSDRIRHRRRPRIALHALSALAVLALLVTATATAGKSSRSPQPALFSDRFTSKRLDTTRWRYWWGAIGVRNRWVTLSSPSPAVPGETHSALITTRRAWRDFSAALTMQPRRQLRLNDPGNTWETSWALFRFRDLANYYYFILKPNGWELGKKQGSDAQLFLATGESPTLAIGSTARVRITVVGPRIQVWVGPARILDFVDPDPLGAGSVGLYEEDATVRFGAVTVAAR